MGKRKSRILFEERVRELQSEIAEEREAELALKKSELILRTVLQGLPIPAFVIDTDHRVILWNRALEELSGISAHKAIGKQQHWNVFYKEYRPCMADLLVDGDIDSFPMWYNGGYSKSKLLEEAFEATQFFPDIGNDGRWIHFTAAVLRDASGNMIGVIETLDDIDMRKKAEKALIESEQTLTSILHGSPIPSFVIDLNHSIIHWNKALEEMSQIKESDVVGTSQHWKIFYSSERPCLADLLVDERLEELPNWYEKKYQKSRFIKDSYEGTDFFPEMGDSGKWLRFTATVLRDSWGNISGAVETLEDITDRKLAEEALIESEKRYRRQSITDALTHLYNSRHFYHQMKRELERANRYSHDLSLLLLDVDNFKEFNDRYGHLRGDDVLVRAGHAIQACLRKTDSAYRFGGEEFTVILPETKGESAKTIAERIRKGFEAEKFFPGKGPAVSKTVSIGVAEYIQGEELSAFIGRADRYMYDAKEKGKNRVSFGNKGKMGN